MRVSDDSKSQSGIDSFSYPLVKELLKKANEKLAKNDRVVFHCIDAFFHAPYLFKRNQNDLSWETKYRELLDSPILRKVSLSYSGTFAKEIFKQGHHFDLAERVLDSNFGAPASNFHSLLTKQLSGIKVLGDFTFAYLEARSNFYYRNSFNYGKSIDSFWCPEGICNLESFNDVLKAHEISKEELVVLCLPVNAIKAFRTEKFGDWTEAQIEKVETKSLGGSISQYDKYGNYVGDVNLVEHKYPNIESPLYKVRVGEHWVAVVPIQENVASVFSLPKDKGGFTKAVLNRIDGNITKGKVVLQVGHNDANVILESGKESLEEIERAINYDFPSKGIISCSVGQAARVAFELLGGFENIPEALLFSDGGCWSSVVTERNSDGRHQGIHNMHDVLKNKWHLREDVAIPWNYLSLDELEKDNEYLLEDEEVFFLSSDDDKTKPFKEKKIFFEAPQDWKKIGFELLKYFIKNVYSEFSLIASRKYHINVIDSVELVSQYLGRAALYELDSEDYQREVDLLEVSDEIHRFLKVIACLHYAACSTSDFYSSKTHSTSISRLQWLASIHKELEDLVPNFAAKFEGELKSILAQDKKTEFTTLESLYFSELNKLKATDED